MDYTYETKCRICGRITTWYFAKKENLKWANFAYAMMDYIKDPRLRQCKTCNRATVQDVVSYTDYNDL